MRILFLLISTLFSSIVLGQAADCQQGLREMEAKRFREAIEPLTKCLNLPLNDRARGYVLETRAVAYRETKEWAAAASDQKQSIMAVKPENVWPLVMLGAYLREDKKYVEALEALTEALKYDEDGAGSGPGMAVYYHTAQTLHQAGRYAEAIEAMTKGIPKQPDYGYALYQRALSYEALGDRARAKGDLSQAMELTPQDGYEPAIAAKLKEYGFEVKVRDK